MLEDLVLVVVELCYVDISQTKFGRQQSFISMKRGSNKIDVSHLEPIADWDYMRGGYFYEN